ncbi:MAG: hypothetical protein QW767_03595 [Thermoprotei archaeon]
MTVKRNVIIVLGSSMVASAFSLSIGGYLLYANSLVPPQLTALTAAAVVVALTLSYFVFHENTTAINVGTILGFAAIAFSASSSAHDKALAEFGGNPLITTLDLLQVFGFYVFPALYIVVRLVYYRAGPAPGNTEHV